MGVWNFEHLICVVHSCLPNQTEATQKPLVSPSYHFKFLRIWLYLQRACYQYSNYMYSVDGGTDIYCESY